jgi:AraC-like DNA-binding protein
MLQSYYAHPDRWLEYRHSRTVPWNITEFHLHNYFEIYFFIGGAVNYFVEKQVYPLKYGDLLLMNHHEIHKPAFRSDDVYERIVIHFEPQLGKAFSAPDCDLLQPFLGRPKGAKNQINLTVSETSDLMRLFLKMERIAAEPSAAGNVLKLSCLIEILVLINQAFIRPATAEAHPNVPAALIPILDYIDGHLDADLTLAALGRRFFMNPSNLSRLFKKEIGSNIHEFIIFKRISQAKKLLGDGCSVTEACSRCGFNDYANFLRMFKRKVGVSPGRYRRG